MTKPTRYRPARPGAQIPMPDRGNRLMRAEGEAVDVTQRYYKRLLDDRDIEAVPAAMPAEPVPAAKPAEKATAQADKPAGKKRG